MVPSPSSWSEWDVGKEEKAVWSGWMSWENQGVQTLTKGVFFRDEERRVVTVPWSGSPVVQIENLFGVEQIVEFPENSVAKKGGGEMEKSCEDKPIPPRRTCGGPERPWETDSGPMPVALGIMRALTSWPRAQGHPTPHSLEHHVAPCNRTQQETQ